MGALLKSLWTDPKVGLGFLAILGTAVGTALTGGAASIPVIVGTTLLSLSGGVSLLHADSPWKPPRQPSQDIPTKPDKPAPS